MNIERLPGGRCRVSNERGYSVELPRWPCSAEVIRDACYDAHDFFIWDVIEASRIADRYGSHTVDYPR